MTTTASATSRRRRVVSGAGIVLSAAASFAGLATGSVSAGPITPARPPAPAITDTDVTSAKLGLTVWMVGNLGNDDSPASPLTCPILRQDQVGFYMGNAGLAPSSTGYLVDIYYDDELGGGTPGVSCGPDLDASLDNPEPATPHYLLFEAFTLDGGTGTFADVIARYSDITLTTAPAPGDLGGEIASGCVSSDMALCLEIWHRDGLAIVMALVGPSSDISEPVAQQLLVTMLPEAVMSLGAAAGTSVTPTVPPTIATAPVTVPVVPTPPVTVPTLPPTIPATVPLVPATVPVVPTVPVLPTVPPNTPTVPTLPVVPTVPSNPPTTPVLPTVPGQTTVPVSIPPGYAQLVDDTGVVTVAVPATWTEVDTVPDVYDDGTPRPYIEVATNIQTFRDTFDAPGVLLVVDPYVADSASEVDRLGITGGCDNEVIEPFTNGVLTGHIGHWTSCGASRTAEFHLVIASPADQSRTVIMQLQITGPLEQEARDIALATFGLVTI